jgi:uncharacterized protein (DUF433 family)
MPTHSYVSSDPDLLSGQPCFAGTRVPIDVLFVNLAAGERLDAILNSFPGVSRQAAVAVLRQACQLVRERAAAGLPPEVRAGVGPVMFERDWEGLATTESAEHYGTGRAW